MDSYPEDLLMGVFPLVFAVNAILPTESESRESEDALASAATTTSTSPRRSLFDRFLDAVAASLIDEGEQGDGAGSAGDTTDKRRNVSLFRPDEDDESSDDDDLTDDFGVGGGGRHRSGTGISSAAAGLVYSGFGRRTISRQTSNDSMRGFGDGMDHSTTNNSGGGGGRISYAKALTHGQGFFQRARIESVSTRHGFPPSKDPDGTENVVHSVPAAVRAGSVQSLKSLFDGFPLEGIVPAGWLEKHAHALPSAIMVVCTVCSSQREQDEQDRRLYETVEHLRIGLVPKRRCRIHVVGLMRDDVTMIQADEWNRAVSSHMLDTMTGGDEGGGVLPPSSDPIVRVSLLRASSDLESGDTGLPLSQSLKRLHRAVRDSSLAYYLGQARRTKSKLAKLVNPEHDRRGAGVGGSRPRRDAAPFPPEPVLPLVVRYCFKIAIFYEFQWKHEKSLRFMAEAYRHVTRYYQYLLWLQRSAQQQGPTTPTPTPSQNLSASRKAATRDANNNRHLSAVTSSHHHSGGDFHGESVEVALDNNSSNNGDRDAAMMWASAVSHPPGDMVHQCRAVADWFNLKLLAAGFGSHTEGGLLAAANQWRHHCRVFCTRRHPPSFVTQEWFEWSYIAHQRRVMSELLERHPPRALGALGSGGHHDEVILRCSPWRTYESAAEATLRLGREVAAVKRRQQQQQQQAEVATELSSSCAEALQNHVDGPTPENRNSKARYVGGLDKEGLAPKLREECKINHREKALELIVRAISIFERELEREKRGFYAEDDFRESSSSRAGARLHYLAGGTLLGMDRHRDAAGHLAKAAKYSRGWRELELSIRRMLIECYEKHIPSQSEGDSDESSQTLASMILDSYFNAEMSSRDLRRALGHFASISGGESLKWYHRTVDEDQSGLPFSFAVTFPETTHATAGDPVNASVFVKSNLDYAVHVNSVALLSLAGQLPIPSNDLLRATNASEGHEGGIIIQAKTSIVLSTQLSLPRDLSIIAADESGNGGEAQGVAGKGSFAKSARPRTAGITSAGGARLVSEKQLSRGNAVSQGWSLRFLGGKPLRCDGLRMLFYPVQAERAGGRGSESLALIELTIEKAKAKTAANIKRTPFEEQNYISSAWARPVHIPFSRGPRCLRVLGPLPQLVVTNLTEAATNGKALEGTVNRILLKLQAGPHERCSDLKYSVSCFTVLMTPNGTTKRLVPERDVTPESEGSVIMTDPAHRTPSLVVPSTEDPSSSSSSPYGYELPPGWAVAGWGHGYTGPSLPSLKGGESSFIGLDMYRPAPSLRKGGQPLDEDEISLCKTDFYVTITYRQERTAAQKQKQRTTRRPTRRKPRMSSGPSAAKGSDAEGGGSQGGDAEPPAKQASAADEVSLEYTGSVVWVEPISATFSPGRKNSCPSASRHPSNAVENPLGADGEFSLIDGECVTTRCSLRADSTAGLITEVVAIRFEDDISSDSPLELSLQSTGSSEPAGLLYEPTPNDPCRVLSKGTKFSVGYTVKVNMKNDYKRGGVSSTLGALLVDWRPSTLEVPDGAKESAAALGNIAAHGPLALDKPATIRFGGPPCYIESAPFEAELLAMPSSARVAVPFEVNYRVKNNTNLHQTIRVRVADSRPSSSSAGEGKSEEGLLISGLVNGEISLAPDEAQVLSYTVLATRAGKTALPKLQVSNERYGSWVINEKSSVDSCLYIFP